MPLLSFIPSPASITHTTVFLKLPVPPVPLTDSSSRLVPEEKQVLGSIPPCSFNTSPTRPCWDNAVVYRRGVSLPAPWGSGPCRSLPLSFDSSLPSTKRDQEPLSQYDTHPHASPQPVPPVQLSQYDTHPHASPPPVPPVQLTQQGTYLLASSSPVPLTEQGTYPLASPSPVPPVQLTAHPNKPTSKESHNMNIMNRLPTDAWNLYLNRDTCADIQAGLNHEWLVTNGLGGYAAGTILGATTRSYHGLLVAALHPPVERTVLVTKIDEEIELPSGQVLRLGVNEYQDGTIDPNGFIHLETFALEGDIPCFTYRLADNLTLSKRIWMEYAQNTTYVQYTLHSTPDANTSNAPFTFTLSPFCLSRDHHSTTQGAPDWHFLVENQGNRCRIRAFDGAPGYNLIAGPSASFTPTGLWYWHVRHRRDTERGLPDLEDVYQPGIFRLRLTPGEPATLILSAEAVVVQPQQSPQASQETLHPSVGIGSFVPSYPVGAQFIAPAGAAGSGGGTIAVAGGSQHEAYVAQALTRHQQRIQQLLTVADPSTNALPAHDPIRARLVLAADQFIVVRPQHSEHTTDNSNPSIEQKTLIAGYPWFTDWGRDSMIALPGLLLATHRYSEARGLLKAFASFTHQGLIPNRFPDSGEAPEYNTVDATLWMFHTIARYIAATGDWTLLKELFPTLSDIIQWHIRGTLYGIGVDPRDGLLRAGVPGVQLTWMDAKIGDWVVTPRRGKPVEVNALWYCALACMEAWALHLSTDATPYSQLRFQVQRNFALRFWYEAGGYLYDVVDVEGITGQNDAWLRPNQLFAAALTGTLLSDAQTRSMLQQVTDHLLTPMGLRTLSPTAPAYHSHFNGNPQQRDSAYHQGTVWPWLIGPYIDVHLRIHKDRKALQPLLQPLIQHLWDTCLGTISEVAEPEPPFTPAGCFAQAWSVSELLLCWLTTIE